MRLSLPDLASLRPLRPQGGRLGLALLCLWALGGILSLSLPRAQLSERTARYYKYYGSYIEYENQQRAYEQQYNNNNNNNNNNDDYNYVPDCKWFQWQCRKQMYYYFQNNDNQDNNNFVLPTWYKFLDGQSAGGEEMRRWQEENGKASADEAPGAIKFVHGYTVFLFLGLLLYGGYVFLTGRAYGGLIATMLLFSQFLLMIMLLLPQGIIATENRELENSIYGWYGQTAVLMEYQDFAFFLFCLSFSAVLGLVNLFLWHRSRGAPAIKSLDGPEGNYYNADQVAVGGGPQQGELV